MKKTLIILASVILSGIVFDGCKKGEGDPTISLKSRKARITGEWTVATGEFVDVSTNSSGSTTTTTKWDGSSVSTTTSFGSTTMIGNGTGSYKVTINKDGTFESSMTATITYATTPSFTDVISETSEGTWNWTGKVGDMKNKSQIVLRTLKETNVYNSSTDINTYEGDDAPTDIWNLFQLKNKELIVKQEGKSTMVSGSTSTSTSTGEMTFTQ